MDRRHVVCGVAAGCGLAVAGFFVRRHVQAKHASAAPDRKCAATSRIVLVRHGESTVNARGKLYREQGDADPGRAYHETEFVDARLTANGRKDAASACSRLQEIFPKGSSCECGLAARLVVVSPLDRAMETAALGVLPLFSPTSAKWVALDLVREAAVVEVHDDGVPKHPGKEKPCNQRRSISHAQSEYPYVDFSQCPLQDPLDPLETEDMLDKRINEFIAWLKVWVGQQIEGCRTASEPKQEELQLDVIVVSHYVFMRKLLARVAGKPCFPEFGMKNGEVRELPLSELLAIAKPV